MSSPAAHIIVVYPLRFLETVHLSESCRRALHRLRIYYDKVNQNSAGVDTEQWIGVAELVMKSESEAVETVEQLEQCCKGLTLRTLGTGETTDDVLMSLLNRRRPEQPTCHSSAINTNFCSFVRPYAQCANREGRQPRSIWDIDIIKDRIGGNNHNGSGDDHRPSSDYNHNNNNHNNNNHNNTPGPINGDDHAYGDCDNTIDYEIDCVEHSDDRVDNNNNNNNNNVDDVNCDDCLKSVPPTGSCLRKTYDLRSGNSANSLNSDRSGTCSVDGADSRLLRGRSEPSSRKSQSWSSYSSASYPRQNGAGKAANQSVCLPPLSPCYVLLSPVKQRRRAATDAPHRNMALYTDVKCEPDDQGPCLPLPANYFIPRPDPVGCTHEVEHGICVDNQNIECMSYTNQKRHSKPFVCPYCNQLFADNDGLLQHAALHGENEIKSLDCETCGRQFKSHSAYHRHLLTCQTMMNADFHIPGPRQHASESKRNADVKSHRKQFGQKLIRVKAEGPDCRDERHRVGTDETYCCNTCGRCFRHPANLRYHIAVHHSAKRYACVYCDRRFVYNCWRRTHQKACRDRPSSTGSSGTAGNDSMSSEVKPDTSRLMNSRLKCEDVPVNYQNIIRSSIARCVPTSHQNTVSKCTRNQTPLKMVSSMGKKPNCRKLRSPCNDNKPFSCDRCGRCFSCPRNLAYHIAAHHSIKPYECLQCGKSFVYNCRLLLHQTVCRGKSTKTCDAGESTGSGSRSAAAGCSSEGHGDVKPNVLGMQAISQPAAGDMVGKNRKTKHDRGKGFCCEICDKLFRHWNSLRSHNARHHNVKQFRCPKCGYCFAFDYELQRHLAACSRKCDGNSSGRKRSVPHSSPAHSGDNLYSCPDCSKTFRFETTLKLHKKFHRRGLLEQSENDDVASSPSVTPPPESTSTTEKCEPPQPEKLFDDRAMHVDDDTVEYSMPQVCRAGRRSATRVSVPVKAERMPFSCGICGQSFQSEDRAVEHFSVHSF